MAPPLPPSAQRYPVGAEVYEIPFVGRVSSTLGENRKASYFRGSLRFLVGRFPPSFFQGFFVTAFRSDGSPSFFDVGQVWDGPVYVAAPPNFGRPLGPYFLAGFATARCPAPSGNTCATAKGKPSFLDVGAVDPQAMYPSPLAPCYGPSCPEFGGGADWDAPAFELPPPSAAPTVQLDTSGGRARVRLELATLPNGTSGQLLEVTTVGGTTSRYLASPSTTVWLEARAGENLLAQAVQSTVGWSQSCAQPMGASGGMLTLRCRDTYYGQQTLITPSQRTWRVSFEANADSAKGCVQVGFRTKRSIYPYYTWYGTYNLGSPPGRVCPGEGWKQVTATLTLHSDTQSVLPWIQIDDNPPHSGAGTAYVRNLSLQPVDFTHYQQLGTSAVFRFAGTGACPFWAPRPSRMARRCAPGPGGGEGPPHRGKPLLQRSPCRNPSGVKDGKAYPADCTSTPDRGMLSLVSESGDVRLSTNTPATVHLHAAIYAPQGPSAPRPCPRTSAP